MLATTFVGGVAALAVTGQNFIIGRRAERRMKIEKKQWEAKQPWPAGQGVPAVFPNCDSNTRCVRS
jgi:hypothetical protein